MQIKYQIQELFYEYPFTTSRETKTSFKTVLLEISKEHERDRLIGMGEAVPAKYYNESPETVAAFYDRLNSEKALEGIDPFNLQRFEEVMSRYEGNMAAKSGLNMALYDLQGKILHIPLYRLWGLDPAKAPKTSYTIGIDTVEEVIRKTKIAAERGYDILKIKLGSANDLDILKAIKDAAPSATVRVDANAGWTLEQALEILPELPKLGVEFVEEPLKQGSAPEDYKKLKAHSPLPLMADESCHTLKDIPKCAEFFHAVNIKLPKTGGLSEALRMVHAAHAHGLKVMFGCFAETSVSITAFAHLSPLADYADLDGSLIITNDPFEGVKFDKNRIILPDWAGIGALQGGPQSAVHRPSTNN